MLNMYHSDLFLFWKSNYGKSCLPEVFHNLKFVIIVINSNNILNATVGTAYLVELVNI